MLTHKTHPRPTPKWFHNFSSQFKKSRKQWVHVNSKQLSLLKLNVSSTGYIKSKAPCIRYTILIPYKLVAIRHNLKAYYPSQTLINTVCFILAVRPGSCRVLCLQCDVMWRHEFNIGATSTYVGSMPTSLSTGTVSCLSELLMMVDGLISLVLFWFGAPISTIVGFQTFTFSNLVRTCCLWLIMSIIH